MRMDCFVITNAFLFDFLVDMEGIIVLEIVRGIKKDASSSK